jgi:hypothetical protein
MGGPLGAGKGEGELPDLGIRGGICGEAEAEINLEGGSDGGHRRCARERGGVEERGGAALRCGESEGEKFSAGGGGELAEIAGGGWVVGGGRSGKPADPTGPIGMTF